MKAIWPRNFVIFFFGRRIMMTRVLSVADKCIQEVVHFQNNPNGTARYKAVKFVVKFEDKA
jgi:hypothetical protein